MSGSEVSRLRFIYTLSLCGLLLPCWGQSSPITSPREGRKVPGEGNAVDPSGLEQYEDMDMHEFLGQFFYMFNLTEPGPRPRPPATRLEPPEYMLELYNRFANDRSAEPSANIVRSFKNEGSSFHGVMSRGVKTHPLLFNVSLPHHEHVILSELHLYLLVQQHRHRHARVNCKITIFERGEGELWRMRGTSRKDEADLEDVEELASKYANVKDGGWEVLDLTDAVHRWRKSESTTHWLEVRIENLNADGNESQMKGDEYENMALADLDVDRSPGGKHTPVLIIFSDDQSKDHREEKRRLNGMITEETALRGDSDKWETAGEEDEEQQNEEGHLTQVRSNPIYDNTPRIRRHAAGDHCKRRSMYVEFKDIGWDKWILAPPGYEAYECKGVCSFPLPPEVTPTRHAMIQVLANLKSPQKVTKPCCVPTKLDPISLLYQNDNGVVTYEHKYEGMVVAECGCR
ncbi:bone morphogenetic protein 10 [Chanos chanos]|uniref:Bone morphogenetic protein 10 n=1 Tax=Chanos chanos TaxID=29144 RepID=A0A6J2V3Q7_CHACN|nr:bone morphogenetic protein 10-like [Chanos chanos]